jgi:hypothetical protein
MIKKFKDWLFKRAKDSPSDEPSIKNAVGFCTIVLTSEDALIVSCDCKDGHDEAMSKMIFLLSSGALMETMNNLVCQKYENDTQTRDRVIEDAYKMMMQNLEREDDDELEDEDPVVDPCNVFKQGKPGVTEDDLD